MPFRLQLPSAPILMEPISTDVHHLRPSSGSPEAHHTILVLFKYGYLSFSLVIVSFYILSNDLVSYNYSNAPSEVIRYSYS